jgi:hypothetical protein
METDPIQTRKGLQIAGYCWSHAPCTGTAATSRNRTQAFPLLRGTLRDFAERPLGDTSNQTGPRTDEVDQIGKRACSNEARFLTSARSVHP